ncbi:MAG: hypothetical protein Q8M11_21240 [Sulfuritalea sp.]|nr:hypothetical protein [Sulfuritalea sp.]MDP1984650.1 hypothetical protein [Sulfuritalea sp.]
MPGKSKDVTSKWQINSIVGTVVESRTYSETNVAGSGGGGYVTKLGGTFNPIEISSTSNECQSISIATVTGDEYAVNIGEPCISVRKGHRLHVVMGRSLGAKDAKPKALYINNLDTNKTARYEYPASRPHSSDDVFPSLFIAGFLWFITFIPAAIVVSLLVNKVPSSLELPVLLGLVALFIFYFYRVYGWADSNFKASCKTEKALIDEAISDAQAEIQHIREQFDRESATTSAAKISICPSCSKQDTSDNKFCGDCGASLLQVEMQS